MSLRLSIDNDNEEKNLEKSKRKQKVNEEIPPPPVPKPDFLKDENHHSEQQLNSVDLPSSLESDRPEFRIVSESQLPKPDETQSVRMMLSRKTTQVNRIIIFFLFK